MIHTLKKAIPEAFHSELYDLSITLRWIASGMKTNPPQWYKHRVLRGIAKTYGLLTCVETGTFMGDTVAAVEDLFKHVVSVELSTVFADLATKRFVNFPHVQIIAGDSAVVMPEIVRSLTTPTLFWLDGHFSGGKTALGSKPTPVIEELDAILTVCRMPFVIAIDDARLFIGTGGYPTFASISTKVARVKSSARVYKKYDVIYIINCS